MNWKWLPCNWHFPMCGYESVILRWPGTISVVNKKWLWIWKCNNTSFVNFPYCLFLHKFHSAISVKQSNNFVNVLMLQKNVSDFGVVKFWVRLSFQGDKSTLLNGHWTTSASSPPIFFFKKVEIFIQIEVDTYVVCSDCMPNLASST